MQRDQAAIVRDADAQLRSLKIVGASQHNRLFLALEGYRIFDQVDNDLLKSDLIAYEKLWQLLWTEVCDFKTISTFHFVFSVFFFNRFWRWDVGDTLHFECTVDESHLRGEHLLKEIERF